MYDGDYVDPKPPVDPSEDGEAIQASNFKLKLSEVKAVTQDAMKEKARVSAWKIVQGKNTEPSDFYKLSEISVSGSILEKVGTYPITFTAPKGTKVTVYATVYDGDQVDPEPPVDPTKEGEVIQASHFKVKLSEVKAVTQDAMKEKAKVSAWKIVPGKPTEPSDIYTPGQISVSGSLPEKVGTYPITFIAPKGAKVTVYATVYDGDHIVTEPEKNEAIQANDIVLKVHQVAGMTSKSYIEKAKATAWSMDGKNTPIAIEKAEGNVQAKKGEYFMKFSTAAGTTVQIKVTVVDNNVITVTFDGNGANKQAVPKTMFVEEPATKLKSLPRQPERAGAIFDGWNTKRDGSGTRFNTKVNVTKDITVYAQWILKDYILSFNANGGTNPPSPQVLKLGDLAKQPSSPVYIGYKFRGWNTQANGSGKDWKFTTDKMPDKNVTLWRKPSPWLPWAPRS